MTKYNFVITLITEVMHSQNNPRKNQKKKKDNSRKKKGKRLGLMLKVRIPQNFLYIG